MKRTIYYFSGTGNSMALARDVAMKTQANLISIPSVVDRGAISMDAESIGLAFPVYFSFNGGIPSIVERFIDKLEGVRDTRIFAVLSFGLFKGAAIGELDKLIRARGGKLAAGFAVRMPYNYTNWSGSLMGVRADKSRKLFEDWKRSIDGICETIRRGDELELEKGNEPADFLKKIGKSHYSKLAGVKGGIKPTAREILSMLDKRFGHSSDCDGCQICARICPVGNIAFENGRPEWAHRCEQCLACVQWCPRGAILMGGRSVSGKRYRHPEARLRDFLHELGLGSGQREEQVGAQP